MEAETTEASSTGGEDNPPADTSSTAVEQPPSPTNDEVDGDSKKEAEDEAAGAADQQEKSTSENSLNADGDTEENNEDEEQPPNKLNSQGISAESENESEELDDIELIFTTEETCRDVGLQEDLVSITDADNWQQHQQARTPTPVILSVLLYYISLYYIKDLYKYIALFCVLIERTAQIGAKNRPVQISRRRGYDASV